MFRALLALLIVSVVGSDASACHRGILRGRIRDRFVHRERHVIRERGTACAAPGVVVVPTAPAPCANGVCPVPGKKK